MIIHKDSHILYIGDSSSQEFIELCGHQLQAPKLVFADPPYNANAAEWDNGFKWKHDYLAQVADIVAVTPGINSLKKFLSSTSMPYQWVMSCFITNGLTHGAVGFANWIPILLFAYGSIYVGEQDVVKVGISPLDKLDVHHKGQKPLAMVKRLIEMYTDPGDIVIDPFLGSGTTLVACAMLDRYCIAADISKDFVYNSIDRYDAFMNGKSYMQRKVSSFNPWNRGK